MRQAQGKDRGSDRAYMALRQMIIRLELEPGSVIDERLTMQKLGIGRTPVREAIARLAAERLVEVVPRRGTFVADFRDGDVWQIFEVRMHVECLAARLAAERIRPEQVARLESLFSSLPDDYDFSGDPDTDWRFHKGIVEASQNRHLMDVVERLYSQSVRLAYLRPSANPSAEVLEEYREILSALRNRDPDRAEAAMATHIARGKAKAGYPGA